MNLSYLLIGTCGQRLESEQGNVSAVVTKVTSERAETVKVWPLLASGCLGLREDWAKGVTMLNGYHNRKGDYVEWLS